MNDIDDMLRQMRNLPLDSRLPDIEPAILAGMDDARRPTMTRRGLAIVVVVSLGVGLGGGLLPTASSATPVSVLGVPGALAPSALLGTSDE